MPPVRDADVHVVAGSIPDRPGKRKGGETESHLRPRFTIMNRSLFQRTRAQSPTQTLAMPRPPRLTLSFGRPLRALTLALGIATALPMTGHAESFTIDYDLSLIGFPIGQATLSGNADPGTYRLELNAKLTGLASIISGGKGTAIATGGGLPGRVLPSSYQLHVVGGGQELTMRMALAGGNVGSISIEPPFQPRPDRVPVLDAHKRGVLDPVSAFLMPVPGRAPVLDPASCNRTLPVFDGGGRFDVSLRFKETTTLKIKGYDGPALLCDVRYTPISGHRAERKSVQFMAENRDIQVWLIPVGGSRIVIPARIMLRTMIGMLAIDARRMTTGGKPLPPEDEFVPPLRD